MERSKLLRASYLDILFDGRNKTYGGYELRSRYLSRARRATVVVITAVSLAASIPLIADALTGNVRTVAAPVVEVPVVLENVPKPKDQVPPVPIVEPPAPAISIRNPELIVVPEDEITETPPTIDELQGKQIALTTNDSGVESPDLIVSNTRVGNGDRLVESNNPPADKIETYVDQLPEFEGDLGRYLEAQLHYPDAARDAGIEGRVGLRFVVNEDGSITTVELAHKASPLLDAEALRVVKAMPKWKPGKINGRPVKSYFTLPISFQLN